jgi:hypothetical protein
MLIGPWINALHFCGSILEQLIAPSSRRRSYPAAARSMPNALPLPPDPPVIVACISALDTIARFSYIRIDRLTTET